VIGARRVVAYVARERHGREEEVTGVPLGDVEHARVADRRLGEVAPEGVADGQVWRRSEEVATRLAGGGDEVVLAAGESAKHHASAQVKGWRRDELKPDAARTARRRVSPILVRQLSVALDVEDVDQQPRRAREPPARRSVGTRLPQVGGAVAQLALVCHDLTMLRTPVGVDLAATTERPFCWLKRRQHKVLSVVASGKHEDPGHRPGLRHLTCVDTPRSVAGLPGFHHADEARQPPGRTAASACRPSRASIG
jgi:hypothetical protein